MIYLDYNMANVDTIQLSGENFVDVGNENIIGLIVVNTHTEDVAFDLMIGSPSLNGTTSTSQAIYVLKSIPVPTGSTFVWDDDNVLSNIFKTGSSISKYDYNKKAFENIDNNNTFLIRLDTAGHVASVLLKRR